MVRRGVCLSLGTRVGLITASNDHPESRLTGSLPLVQKILAGFVLILPFFFLFLKAVLVFFFFPPAGGNASHDFGVLGWSGRGGTIRPMAQMNPASSRPSAAAATVDFLCRTRVRCL